jgi:hypothetical protein
VDDGLVKVMEAKTGELKRWETPAGKPMAVMEKGSLVLTVVGRKMGYEVKGRELFKI